MEDETQVGGGTENRNEEEKIKIEWRTEGTNKKWSQNKRSQKEKNWNEVNNMWWKRSQE